MDSLNNAQSYILNEKTKAEDMISNKIVSHNLYKSISVISKYLRIEKNMQKIDIENYIINFLAESYSKFHIVKTPELVETIVGRDWRRKDNYKIIKSIKIMEDELEHIRQVDNIILEKIMFVMLVDAKRNNISSGGTSGRWTSLPLESLLKDAKLHGTYERKFLQTYKIEGLNGNGIISNKGVDANSYEVLFSDISYSGEVAFELVDMKEYVLEYMKWRGENIGICGSCGIRIIKSIHNKTYCQECAEEQDRLLARDRMRKARNVRSK